MVSELAAYRVEAFSVAQISSELASLILRIPERFWKFVSAAFLGFLVGVSGLVERKKNPDRGSSMALGGFGFGILSGLLGIVIPTVYNPWVNYLGYPIVEVVALLMFARIIPKSKTG